MIAKLENLFQNALTTSFIPDDDNHFWFKTDDDIIFGLLKSEVTHIEINLVRSLFTPIDEDEYSANNQSKYQKKWHEFLFKDSKELPTQNNQSSVRFFYFHLKQPIDDLANFKLAITGGFQQPIIIMLSHTHGVIIEEKPHSYMDQHALDQLTDTLISDFLVEIYSYIGQLHDFDLSIKEKFTLEYNYFNAAHRFATIDKSKTFYDVMPLLLIHSPVLITKAILSNKLISVLENSETLHTIQVFLQCNLNASLTAKTLFIHRNSLQYRLDKFIDATGIDIRSFANASFISTAIILTQAE